MNIPKIPITSLKNYFTHSNQGTQSHAKRNNSNTSSINVKWETIVKTSNLQHGHVRYSHVTFLIPLSIILPI